VRYREAQDDPGLFIDERSFLAAVIPTPREVADNSKSSMRSGKLLSLGDPKQQIPAQKARGDDSSSCHCGFDPPV